ncbi:hypothetical protein CIRG_05521 [Coccidioides immitis RMSCC 2394]|uniref:Uncharacterized protein n=1 Tax=Coccidioides immitis RMSCC 2394 TaxID=404692 RepID=A0A0J6YDT4_COCIT|nr:hypothetical protein CIRG_05521 [Coccidioides immitis RMSCC 2394]
MTVAGLSPRESFITAQQPTKSEDEVQKMETHAALASSPQLSQANHGEGTRRCYITPSGVANAIVTAVGSAICKIIALLDGLVKINDISRCIVSKNCWINKNVVLKIWELEEIF